MYNQDLWLAGKQSMTFRYKMEKFLYGLELLGHPELVVPVIHVAGTNGKGSTVAFLRQLFQDSGYRVGTFTSPHLISVHDRICINGLPISEEDLDRTAREICELEQRVMEVYEPFSYFETMTLVMFLYFSRAQLDVAVIEVGIGGLHDVTNVVHPLVSVITSIGLDHQEMLGDSIEAIAEQKAGIIKPNSPVVIGPLSEEILSVIEEKAAQEGVKIHHFGRDFQIDKGCFRNQEVSLSLAGIGLAGQHQAENAAVALQSFLLFMARKEWTVDKDAVARAIQSVSWPGRLELVHQAPQIYLDGAHNLPAITRLVDFIASRGLEEVTILFSALARKDVDRMLGYLQENLPAARLVLTSFDHQGVAVGAGDGYEFVQDYPTFLAEWQATASADASLFVTGSLYFISEVRPLFISATDTAT